MELSYLADVNISLDVGVCLLGISRIECSGVLTVVARPLIAEVPIAGAFHRAAAHAVGGVPQGKKVPDMTEQFTTASGLRRVMIAGLSVWVY